LISNITRRYAFISITSLLLIVTTLTSVNAQSTSKSELSIQLDKHDISLTAGDWSSFAVAITNDGRTETPPLIAYANIARTTRGIFADPEECFPNVSHYLKPLQPGETINLRWELLGVFEGEFVSYITLLSKDKSFSPIVSSPVHINVQPNRMLPLKEVIPTIIIVPSLLGVLSMIMFVYDKRKRSGYCY